MMIKRSPDRGITKELFEAISTDNRPRRICFATMHKNQPKRGTRPDYVGTLNVPFREAIGGIFEAECSLKLRDASNGFGDVWTSIKTKGEFERVEAWDKRQGTRLFLRDCLDLSMALDVNIKRSDNGWEGYTDLGRLENRTKQTLDEETLGKLVSAFVDAIRELPFYRDARMIAAVPAHPTKTYDLPRELASRVAATLGLADVTSRLRFVREKRAVKDSPLAAKWEARERSGLTFTPHLEGEPAVILIDDKYQSGTSIQFVASVLRAASMAFVRSRLWGTWTTYPQSGSSRCTLERRRIRPIDRTGRDIGDRARQSGLPGEPVRRRQSTGAVGLGQSRPAERPCRPWLLRVPTSQREGDRGDGRLRRTSGRGWFDGHFRSCGGRRFRGPSHGPCSWRRHHHGAGRGHRALPHTQGDAAGLGLDARPRDQSVRAERRLAGLPRHAAQRRHHRTQPGDDRCRGGRDRWDAGGRLARAQGGQAFVCGGLRQSGTGRARKCPTALQGAARLRTSQRRHNPGNRSCSDRRVWGRCPQRGPGAEPLVLTRRRSARLAPSRRCGPTCRVGRADNRASPGGRRRAGRRRSRRSSARRAGRRAPRPRRS